MLDPLIAHAAPGHGLVHYFGQLVSAFLAGPLLLALMLGGIRDRIMNEPVPLSRMQTVRIYFFRLFFIQLTFYLFYVLVYLLVSFLSVQVLHRPVSMTAVGLIFVPFNAFKLIWISLVFMENGAVWRALFRTAGVLADRRVGLYPSVIWAAFGLFYGWFESAFDGRPHETAMTGFILMSVFRACLMLVCYSVSMIRYKENKPMLFGEVARTRPAAPVRKKKIRSPETLLFRMALWSFVPLVHLAVLGRALRLRKPQGGFQPRIWFSMVTGAFFTLVYALLLVSTFIPDRTEERPDYSYLYESGTPESVPVITSVVMLMNQGDYAQADSILEAGTDPADSSWNMLAVKGILVLNGFGTGDPLVFFQNAERRGPASGAFYYEYGRALLMSGQAQEALERFDRAAELDPHLSGASLHAALIRNRYEPDRAVEIASFILIILLLLTLHEFGHAWSAYQLGDDTAKLLGRVTLNPLPHIDLFGTILLPGLLLVQGAPFLFGWAKPVPVVPSRLRNPAEDDIAVSFAGPAMNFFVVMICFILLFLTGIGIRIFNPEAMAEGLTLYSSYVSVAGTGMDHWLAAMITFVKTLMLTSLVLGIFNLIPIPPLDGSHILRNLLPLEAREKYEMLRPFSMIIFVVLVVTRLTSIIFSVFIFPVAALMEWCFSLLGLG